MEVSPAPTLTGRAVMPGMYSVPLDTTLPGATRRRTWAHPELTSHSLAVLTFERLYLAPLVGTPTPDSITAAEAGADLETLLGPLAIVVDLVAVRRLALDLLTNSLVVEYVGTGLGTRSVRLTFATPEAADACFTKLWRRLGDGYRLTPYQRDSWSLARAPLALLVAALFATACLVLLASIVEDAGSSAEQSPRWWLNWRFVCAVGGIVAAVSQVWLYRRLTTPPVRLELIRN